jgi:hypothetical protein
MPDNTESLTRLSDLLLDLQQNPNEPYKMSALRGAKNIFMPDPAPKPAGNPGSGITPQGSEEDVADEYRLRSQMPPSMDDLQISPPPIPSFSSVQSSGEAGGAAGVQNTGQESGYTNKHVLDNQEEEARPGFFKSDQFKNIANMGMGLLGGALGGALSGNWRAGMAGGGAVQLADFQQKQKDMLDRRHKAWESAYNEAAALPADIHTTPGMEEVAKAQQALMKDLQDGKVDNEQNLTNFLKVKAMYGGDIEKMTMDRKLADQKRMEDEKFQNDAMRKSQRAESLQAIVADPMTPEPQKQAAMAELATIRQDLEIQKDRDATREATIENQRRDDEYRRASLGVQQQGLGIQQQRLNQQDKIFQDTATLRNSEANRRNFVNNWQKELALRMKDTPSMEQAMGDQALAHKNEIIQMAGIQDVSGGNVIMNGQTVPLINLIGKDPAMWDEGGTPSLEGWKVLLSDLANREISKPVQMPERDLRLTDIGQ